MKKFSVLFLAGLLILAFGTLGYAQAPKFEFRASGSFDVQSHLSVNVPPLNANATPIFNSLPGDYKTYVGGLPVGAIDRTVSYWDSRFALRFEAAMGKEITGVLQFEIDGTRWGDGQGGIRPGSEAHQAARWSADATAVEVKYMYLDAALPYMGIPVPMSLRGGVQPMAIRPWFFAATDGAGLSAQLNVSGLGINPFYFKAAEGIDWVNDDVDIYGLQANYKFGTVTVGGYGVNYNMNQYPMKQDFLAVSPPVVYVPGYYKANFWWWGLYADGKVGPFNMQFDIGADNGKVWDPANSYDKVTYFGWAGRLKVDYPWERFNFGGTGMYASGSSMNKTSQTGLPGTTTANGNGMSYHVNGWMVPIGSETGAANQESAVFYGMEPGASGGQGWAVDHNYTQNSKGAFGGTWFAKLFGSYMVTPKYKLTLQALYIGDTTTGGNTYGTARNPHTGFATYRNDSDIGFEVDILNEWNIYKNLTFKVFGGYLFAGGATDLFTGNYNHKLSDPWAIRTRLIYTF